MSKHLSMFVLGLVAIAGSVTIFGCAETVVDKPVKLASQADVAQANVSKAKTFLDQLEKMPKKNRQANANKPKMASVLKAAASDPDTKKRMDDLGVTVE